MYTSTLLVLALGTASLVSAHGKVTVVTGNAGGNGTALGIKGASVATFGENSETESDTTVFGGNANDPTTDGLGETTSSGKLSVSDLKDTMTASGDTLPQVTNDGTGNITGTWQVVTSDGTANTENGNMFAVIDSTGTGKYSTGTQLTAKSDLVGNGQGNVVQRAVRRALVSIGLAKRATNVGATSTFTVTIPSGTTCTGTDATSGQSNFCLMKVANNNNAGPFGGSFAFQISGAGNSASTNTTSAKAATTSSASKSAKAAKANRRALVKEAAFKA